MTDNPSAGTQYHVMVDSDAYTVMSEFTPASSNATSYQSEAALEDELIRILTSQGYDYLAIDSEQALIDNLRAQVEALNRMTFSNKEWKRLCQYYLIRPGETIVEKARRVQTDHVFELIRDDGTHVNVKILDKEHVTNNRLQVINQYVAKGKHDTLWADKNLQMHGLIQAFSRTNRILNSVKTFGNVVCFRNLEDEVEKALSMYGDREAGGVVLLKPYGEYLEKYLKKVIHLRAAFPLDDPTALMTDEAKRDLVVTFGSILRLRNVLTAWDQFDSDDIMCERELQDYQSLYIETWRKIREGQQAETADIVEDLRFEVELVKMVEVNIDYILRLVQKYHDGNCEDKEIVGDIERAISASLALRDKRDLIENFVAGMSVGDDAREKWQEYVHRQMQDELGVMVRELNLKLDETTELLRSSFAEGGVPESGTAVNDVMRPMSRFARRRGGASRAEAKARVIERLQAYYERFCDFVTVEYDGTVLF